MFMGKLPQKLRNSHFCFRSKHSCWRWKVLDTHTNRFWDVFKPTHSPQFGQRPRDLYGYSPHAYVHEIRHIVAFAGRPEMTINIIQYFTEFETLTLTKPFKYVGGNLQPYWS